MSVKHQESLPTVDEVNGGAVQHCRVPVDWEEVTAGMWCSNTTSQGGIPQLHPEPSLSVEYQPKVHSQ